MKNNPSSDIVGVVEHQSTSYVRSVFAALNAGKTVVPLRSNQDEQRIRVAGVSDVVTVTSDDNNWYEPKLDIPSADSIVYIAFTSGTEGLPKAVRISGGALNNTVERLQAIMQMDSTVKEYIGVPVYHSFGFGRCRHVAAVGGCCYVPPNGFDPRELASLLAKGRVNALSLVPSLLRLLIQSPSLLDGHGDKLRWLEIGSQAMTAAEKRQIKVLFPNAKIIQHYGLTEASRTTLLSLDSVIAPQLDSVGCCYGSTAIKINDNNRICIRGEHLATDVHNGEQGVSVPGKDGWFETTDLGRIDEDGFLYFLGRADNVVNCGGQKLSTERLEVVLHQRLLSEKINGVELAVSRIPNASYGEGFLVSYVITGVDGNALSRIKAIAQKALVELGITANSALSYQVVSQLPKTSTGKVQHHELTKSYMQSEHDSQQGDDAEVITALSWHQLMSDVAAVIGVPMEDVDYDQTIKSIGVDSLQTVQLSIKIELFLGSLPPNWREISFSGFKEISRTERLVSSDFKSSDAAENSGKYSHASTQACRTKAPPLWDGSSNRNPKEVSFVELVKEDYRTHDSAFFSQGLFALFVNRFGNWRMGIRYRLLRFPMTLMYRLLRKMAQVCCGIKLDYTVQVGRRVKLEHFGGMIIGARQIGDDVIIRQNTTLGIRDLTDLSAKPTIEQGVNIGTGAVIVGDIVVGRHSVIGPNCVVTDNIPAFSVVSAGKPTITSLASVNE
ncbi:AMP-binding protein [Eionea flava]